MSILVFFESQQISQVEKWTRLLDHERRFTPFPQVLQLILDFYSISMVLEVTLDINMEVG